MSEPDFGREPLPAAPRPQGAYVPWVRHHGLIVTSGMTPRDADGALVVRGTVGADVDLPTARHAASVAARNALAAVVAALDDPDEQPRCLRMTVYVACADGFTDLSVVADGASEVLDEHLGREARPVRTAVGVRALPGGAPVEIELTAAVPDPV